MRKPLDVVLCANAYTARDLFMDARDLAREQRTAIGWTSHRYGLEYTDRVVEWWPVSAVGREARGRQVHSVHVDAGVPADLLTDDVVGAVLAAQLPADGRRDWTWGDRQTEQTVQGGRRDTPADSR